MSEEIKQYSIWIIPPEPLYGQIRKVIDELANKYGGPTFEPHMTLLGRINGGFREVEQGVGQLASHAHELELSLGPVSFSTTYFQSVFVRVNSTAELMRLNLEAKKLFKLDNSVFMPHISLFYGADDMEIREKAASEVHLPAASFVANEFVITPATDDLREWTHTSAIPFKRK